MKSPSQRHVLPRGLALVRRAEVPLRAAVRFFFSFFWQRARVELSTPASLTSARRSGRLPIRWELGRPGASCCGEPVSRSILRARAGVSGVMPLERRMPCRQPSVPTTIGDALDVPENWSVYQKSSLLRLEVVRPACRHLAPPALHVDCASMVGENEVANGLGHGSLCVPGGGAPAPTKMAPKSRLARLNGLVQPDGNPGSGVL